jgi:phage terminase large subunit
MKNIDIKTNIIWKHLSTSDKRIIIEQGGTRSGKTYNILLWIIFDYCSKNRGKIITICRKTYPALRATAMRDFFEILKNNELYDEQSHNKSSSEFQFNGNTIEFISLDKPTKIRGRKRDLLYVNEANEITFEDWQQLIFRTTGRIILDYNPSDEFHFIYDKIKSRDDADFFVTTYKNNPFLSDDIIQEIERLKDIDDNYWKIYGLGEIGSSKSIIFRINEVREVPSQAKLLAYGMDFGYTNDPSTIVAVYLLGDELYLEELLYKTNLTNQDIANEFTQLGFDRRTEIFADDSEPKSIEEIYRMGWNIKKANKKEVLLGIDMMKRYRLNVTMSSVNMIKEFKNYKWVEDKNGNVLNKPVDMFNHTIDAIRYVLYNKLSRPNYGKYAIR